KQKHIAFGYSDGTYGLDRPVTRGAMAAYLSRIANPGDAPAKCTAAPYRDVAVSDTCCPVITWVTSSGITVGIGDGQYGTTLPVTRQSMATFLHRMADRPADVGYTYTLFVDGEVAAKVGALSIQRVNHALSDRDGAPKH